MDYVDLILMIEDIRGHVLANGHKVTPADDPMRQMLGYCCPDCEMFWYIGLTHVKALEGTTLYGFQLSRLYQRNVRELLTEYLNKIPTTTPSKLNRYKRPWVI